MFCSKKKLSLYMKGLRRSDPLLKKCMIREKARSELAST